MEKVEHRPWGGGSLLFVGRLWVVVTLIVGGLVLVGLFFAAPAAAQLFDFSDETQARVLEDRLSARVGDMTGYSMASHEAADGPQLAANDGPHLELALGAETCPTAAPVKTYDIAALRTKIYLNRWGDNDPVGFLFTDINNVNRVRASASARAGDFFGISLGLADDPIQPMTMRINIGDCLRVGVTNLTDMATSFHVHGADLILAETGEPALSTNPNSTILPEERKIYEWYVNPDFYGENTHYAHPHGPAARFQVSHGLFAAVIVEPLGSEYYNPRSGASLCAAAGPNGGRACTNSWDAMISPGEGDDFREFALFYHEIGHEDFNARRADGSELPAIDPLSATYKPSGRAINYRSESFAQRLAETDRNIPFYSKWQPDGSLAYSSYSYGDPATPIPQSYLGDPVKFRLIHGGSEVIHVPHLHGGGVQWQRQPEMGKGSDENYVPINGGLQKQFAAALPSSATDSQTIGPSETYDLEIGCGSGGCQQSVGDYLFHCHVASHYIAGMWHFWRVYNSLQDEAGKTDELALVLELPDRQGSLEGAVTSQGLIGKAVDFAGRVIQVAEDNLGALVEAQLPPPGVPMSVQDAQVFDWAREDSLYLNEPETDHIWPNFASSMPGQRPPLLFAPDTGKLAWPFLRPHLGQRPPFAPHHGPAAYLEPLGHDARHGPPPPGANGAASLCPEGAPQRQYKIHAIQLPIPMTPSRTEEDGMLFVLQEQEELVRSDPNFRIPLAIRANQGDCVDVILVNELQGLTSNIRTRQAVTKTNIHIHFLQFDVQSSDGVPSGGAFEQSPRPIVHDNQTATIGQNVAAGANRLGVSNGALFHRGAVVAIGIHQSIDIFETATIADIQGNELVLAQPLLNAHDAGELVSVEFVRYRWYVARQNGGVYFHDHVDALQGWPRGLFGALVAEPRDATFHDPQTGDELISGPIADIHTAREVVPGLTGSFREFVLFLSERHPQSGSAINMRADPIDFGEGRRERGKQNELFSSLEHGDPVTPLLEAYAGDPIMLRAMGTATDETNSLILTGHQFRAERFRADSPMTNNMAIGVSERFNAYIPSAGGPTKQPGDYLYYSGVERFFRRGAWGLLRVHNANGDGDGLQPLPGRAVAPQSQSVAGASEAPVADGPRGEDICPAAAPVRRLNLAVASVPLEFDDGNGRGLVNGRRYILYKNGDRFPFLTSSQPPLVIRANAGDCLEIEFYNDTTGIAGFNIEGANFDPLQSFGAAIGRNPDSVVEGKETKIFRYYLPSELGVLRIRTFGSAPAQQLVWPLRCAGCRARRCDLSRSESTTRKSIRVSRP